MPSFPRVTYSGATPGGDANTYNLYTSINDGGANGFALKGVHKFILDLKNSQAGTLKAYKSADRGVNWNQIYQSSVAAAAATGTNQFEFVVEPFADWKLDWVNGGVAQATWFVDMALSDQRGQVGSVQEATADASAAAADATANPTLVGRLAYLMGFNGATWDRVRTAIVAKTATFTGILNTLPLGRYNLTPATLTDGDAQLLQLDASGNLRAAEQYAVGWNFANITTATTTTAKSGAGVLRRIIVNTLGTTPTITVYDNTAASGTKIATIVLPAAGAGDMPMAIEFDAAFATGLTVVTSATCDITVIYL